MHINALPTVLLSKIFSNLPEELPKIALVCRQLKRGVVPCKYVDALLDLRFFYDSTKETELRREIEVLYHRFRVTCLYFFYLKQNSGSSFPDRVDFQNRMLIPINPEELIGD